MEKHFEKLIKVLRLRHTNPYIFYETIRTHNTLFGAIRDILSIGQISKVYLLSESWTKSINRLNKI
ncbi:MULTISPECIES: hypothetical protein [Arenibacter]|uniref:hypothetical protein n=1 Tax=Arenibacter TaxID=178469 RepID=UPI00130008B6|nr:MULTISPECIES: hypothetical protein [Arenibacter]